MIGLSCLLCQSRRWMSIHQGPLRAGRAGTFTDGAHKVLKCDECGLVRLEEFPDQKRFYETAEYREAYNGSAQTADYLRVHDQEQTGRIAVIGVEKFRKARVLDYGCGGGAFLDLVKGLAQVTYAIEPCREFHAGLRDRGHTVYSDGETAAHELKGTLDIVISFGVIEHVTNPLQYLEHVRDLLKPGGRAYLETDNLDELLMKMEVPEFRSFYFRTAHLWYFNRATIERLAGRAGLNVVVSSFRHTYDISNTLLWLRDRKPTGHGGIPLFSASQDRQWKKWLEENGMADLIFLELRKPQ